MPHSVESHLALAPAAYDAAIRRFIPSYEEMLDCAVELLSRLVPPTARVLDLGAGTGALSQRVAARLPQSRLTLLDADAEMLEQARSRLATETARVDFRCGSFFDRLPAFDAAVASFALHHVRTLDEKRGLYRNVRAALPADGVLINADVTVPAAPELARLLRAEWAAHLIAHGDTEAEAYARFAAWAKEDTYFSAEEELLALRDAGFRGADVAWRRGPGTVLVALV